MSAGMWLTVGVSGNALVFTDDDLQYWCERCAFGIDRDKAWSPKRQQDELAKALQAVGV